jgi:hypothetical protein
MKFKTEKDRLKFELLDLNEDIIRKKVGKFKNSLKVDRDKSRNAKNSWRRNKRELTKGIQKWHKSTKGKRFHKALGRFNALREFKESYLMHYYYKWNDSEKIKEFNLTQDTFKNKTVDISYNEVIEALFSLNSIESHLILELRYYEPDFESLYEFIELVDDYFEFSQHIRIGLLESIETGIIDLITYDDLISVIQYFLDPKVYLYQKREDLNLSNDINSPLSNNLDEQLKFIDMEYSNSNLNEFYNKFDRLLNH